MLPGVAAYGWSCLSRGQKQGSPQQQDGQAGAHPHPGAESPAAGGRPSQPGHPGPQLWGRREGPLPGPDSLIYASSKPPIIRSRRACRPRASQESTVFRLAPSILPISAAV